MIVQTGGLISAQVLNELANVARRKLSMSWGGNQRGVGSDTVGMFGCAVDH